MKWIWQLENWPNFYYDEKIIAEHEKQFLWQIGTISGIAKCLEPIENASVTVDLISDEALNTSEIEGEYLNRASLRSSIRRQLGLGKERTHVTTSEEGIAEMLVNLYQHSQQTLNHDTLGYWHEVLTRSRWDLNNVGNYRTHQEAMQIVSGAIGHQRIHYEAPPSDVIPKEMNAFFTWYNQTKPKGATPLPAITRAAIAHLYFICIHPFEDGNGRLARAISVKSLSESLGQSTLLSLSQVIIKHKKHYYQALAQQNYSLDITAWLHYFAETILAALGHTQKIMEFLIAKAKFFDAYEKKLNTRQLTVIKRMLKEGINSFKRGLSAKNYTTIAKSSASTTTRDLQELVNIGALTKTGERKNTRYFLTI